MAMLLSEMADSTVHDRGGKRERLVASAGDLLHCQGVAATTIAQVPEAADVPPGNVYYYFKTKDDLVRAVIESRAEQVGAMLDSLQSRRSPAARLKALAHQWVEMRDLVARYGCPFGTLAAELDRRDDGLDREAAKPISVILDWAEDQFRQMGRRDARELAVSLFSGVQGGALLANALRDPDLMTSQVRHLDRWIDWYANIDSVTWRTPAPVGLGSRMDFVARFLGRRLAYTYEVVDLVPGERLVMRTAQGPFPMETTYSWRPLGEGRTRMTLRNRGEPAGLGKIAAPALAVAMRRANRKDLANLSRDASGQPEGLGQPQTDSGGRAVTTVAGRPKAGNRCGVTKPVMALRRPPWTVSTFTANGVWAPPPSAGA
jgi:TetR/AcrR family transcriptional repressor of nem operon